MKESPAIFRRLKVRSLLVVGAILPWMAVAALGQDPAKVDFAKDVFPVLKSKCGDCHGADGASGGLRLDTLDGIRKGGNSGKLYEPFKSGESLIVKRLLGQDGKPRMPMGFAPLPDETIAKIRAWIDAGAVIVEPGTTKHWSYVPPVRPALPAVGNPAWSKNPIDRFVYARLEKEGLKPSPEASKETLARRAALDITGLPPTLAQLDAFLADRRPDAYERYVDRLLSSPHYGERMARIWLDLARYADTNGYEKDLPRQIWAWRDWVIDAFNRNMPYDEFTIEQLAGDLLPKPTRDQLVATGFNRNSMLNDEGGIDPEEFRVVAVMDRIDATATTWLGSTLACAQCHNHKYDPFTQKDYYSFFAFFNRSEDNGRDTAPTIRLYTEAQQAVANDLSAEIKDYQARIKAMRPTVLAAQVTPWDRDWTVVKPSKAEAEGAHLSILDDSSILASGPDPKADLYRITVPLSGLSQLAGLRIEAIPDAGLPEHSSGRNENGNFVLRHVEAMIVHRDGSMTPLKLATATADFSQQDFDPQSTISDGPGLGWAIAAFQPENRTLHQLAISLAGPYKPSSTDRLQITLRHQTRFPHHNLGRFRISLTSNRRLAAVTPPTVAIAAVIAKPADKRTAEEQKQAEDYFLRSAPELAETRRHLDEAQMRLGRLEAKVPTTMVMRDLPTPRPDHILKRGDFRTPGDPVEPATPECLGGKATRPDRLGLARWLVDPKNPLTARVEVNRLWEQCFGRGIVATPEDFGSQGDPPSHPELLDWLATEFVAKKWDVKAMLRLIVTSETYKQSSRVTPDLLAKDPNNTLLARGPRFRAEAEMIRDIALTASGLLSEKIGGPSVMPPQPPGIWENSFSFYDTKERWKDATGPDRYRRGLYTYWRRTAPYPMALTFDLKSRDMCVAHRSRTNSPLQALNLLNDPVFLECAGRLGVKMSQAKDGIVYGFRACTGRTPSAKEVAILEQVRRDALADFRRQGGAATAEFLRAAGITAKEELTDQNAAWIAVANTILNLDETITKG
ncbi:MAG TPA: PSD1 and planctomycete cytochrome C domain-containing protein [Fimbriimonadaceae bacterium]|nr:PSD1 and planctomycete cytochrome C domain-containing protein [Fimbriimonadaceae bacterium]